MGLEAKFTQRIESQTEESKKKDGKSIKEIFQDRELWNIMTLTLKRENREDLAEKFLRGEEGLSESERDELLAARKEVLDGANKTDQILEVLGNETIINNISEISPDLTKLKEQVGTADIAKLVTKDYLINLYLDKPMVFENLRHKATAYKKIETDLADLDKKMADFSQSVGIPAGKMEEVLDITDSGERLVKMKELFGRFVLPKFGGFKRKWGFIPVPAFTTKDNAQELENIGKEFENIFAEGTRKRMALGKDLQEIFAGDDRMAKRIDDLMAGRKLSPEREPEMSFSEVAGVIKDKENIAKKWERYKVDMVAEIKADTKISNLTWDNMDPKKKADLENSFRGKELHKGKKKSWWAGIIDKIIELAV